MRRLMGPVFAGIVAIAALVTPAAAKNFYKLGDLDAASACEVWHGRQNQLRSADEFWRRALALGFLSAAAYKDLAIGDTVTTGGGATPFKWRVVDRIEKQPDEMYLSGVVAYAFQNAQTKEVVIAVRGSESENDWVRNLAVRGKIGDQHLRLWRFARYVARNYGSDFRTLTGHSRGGQLAAFGALMTGRDALIFNASILPDDFTSYGIAHGRRPPPITNIESALGDTFNITKLRIPDLVSISSNLIARSKWYSSTRQIVFGGDYSYFTQVDDMKDYWIALDDTDWLGSELKGGAQMMGTLWHHPLAGTTFDLHSIQKAVQGLSRVSSFLDRGVVLTSSCH